MSVKKKGLQGYKRDNLPFIIISNYAPEDVYPKLFAFGQLGPFLSRLEVVKVEKIDIENIQLLPPPPEEEPLEEGHFQDREDRELLEKEIGVDTNGSPLFEAMEESSEED